MRDVFEIKQTPLKEQTRQKAVKLYGAFMLIVGICVLWLTWPIISDNLAFLLSGDELIGGVELQADQEPNELELSVPLQPESSKVIVDVRTIESGGLTNAWNIAQTIQMLAIAAAMVTVGTWATRSLGRGMNRSDVKYAYLVMGAAIVYGTVLTAEDVIEGRIAAELFGLTDISGLGGLLVGFVSVIALIVGSIQRTVQDSEDVV